MHYHILLRGGGFVARKTKEEAMRTKQKLLDSALEVMCERPYSRISMTEIAERIGYSKGAIYWHFNNKHDLLLRLVDASCAITEEVLSEAVRISGDQSLDGLRSYYKHLMSFQSQNNTFKMFHKLMHNRHEWPGDVLEKVTSLLTSRINKECKAIETMLIGMQKEGKMNKSISAKGTAALISAVFHGLFMFQVEGVYNTDFAMYVDPIFDSIQRDLLVPCSEGCGGREGVKG